MASSLRRLDDRPESLSEIVYESLCDAIVDMTLPPGTTVTEVGLARQLNVSKTPVREALLRLRELSVIETNGTHGLRVATQNRETITHAYEARSALEAAVASFAAARASDSQLAELENAAEQSLKGAEANDPEAFRRWDEVFHGTVAEAAANPHLTRMAKNSFLLTRVLRARDVQMSEQESVKCALDHVKIADAIRSNDSALAGDLASEHVRYVLTKVLAAFLANQPMRRETIIGRETVNG